VGIFPLFLVLVLVMFLVVYTLEFVVFIEVLDKKGRLWSFVC